MKPESIHHDLLAKYLLGETSAAEVKQVEQWLQQSPENQREFNSLKQLFQASAFKAAPADVDADKAWKNVKAKMDGGAERGRIITMERKNNFKTYFSVAAAIVALAVAAVVIRVYQHRVPAVQYARFTAASQKQTDTLPDGSVVTLNKNTTLTYPVAFANNERKVTLHGEAFFDVVKDSTRPFIIEAGGAEIKVLGTSFNVRAYDTLATVEVVVETGIVQLRSAAKNESVMLEPGSKGVYTKTNAALSKSSNDDLNYAFWRSNKLTFRNTPLKEVVDALNNYYAAGISYENENIGRCRFTATFEHDSLSAILEILSVTFQLEITQGVSGKILSGRGCEDAQL